MIDALSDAFSLPVVLTNIVLAFIVSIGANLATPYFIGVTRNLSRILNLYGPPASGFLFIFGIIFGMLPAIMLNEGQLSDAFCFIPSIGFSAFGIAMILASFFMNPQGNSLLEFMLLLFYRAGVVFLGVMFLYLALVQTFC